MKLPALLLSLLMTTVAFANETAPDNLHIVLRYRSDFTRESLVKLHDSCVNLVHPAIPVPPDSKLLDQASIRTVEDFFAKGKHARYETGEKIDIDRNTCTLIDKGPLSTVLIEDGKQRIQADLVGKRGQQSAQAAARNAATTPKALAAAAGEHLTFAGQPCTAQAQGSGASKVCLWDKLPYYPLADGHVTPVQLMIDAVKQGTEMYRVEAMTFQEHATFPADKFKLPNDIPLSGVKGQ